MLIGRATFSAAANFAADVDRLTKATFIGEPTGGFVEGYGDTVSVLLPKSGINVHIAARYWDFGKGPSDRRLAVNPDRKVNVTIADFLAGRDPVLAGGAQGLTSANCGRFVRGTPCARSPTSHSVVLAPSTERE